MHEAIRIGDREIVQYLLERGADANARTGINEEGGSPLYLVREYHRDPRSIDRKEMEFLLQKYDAKLHKPVYSRGEL